MKKIRVTLKNPNSVDFVLCLKKNCAEDGWSDKNDALYFEMAHYTTDTRYYKTFFTEEEIIEGGFTWTLNSSGVKIEEVDESLGYRVNLEKDEKIIFFECFGDSFPIHEKEWEEHKSLFQEDYFRFVLQRDIGLLTIYDARYEQAFLWQSSGYHFSSLQDIYTYLNEWSNPFATFIYGDIILDKDENGNTTNFYLEKIREKFNRAYEFYFLNSKIEKDEQE
jgi:hypothetical protein